MNAYAEFNQSTAIPAHVISGIIPPIEIDAVSEPDNDATAIIDREPLTRALYVAMAAIERRTNDAILQNIRLQEVNNALQITGTDIDIEIAITVSASIDAGFATTIPAHQAHALLAKSRKSDFVSLEIDQESDKLGIDTEKTTFNLNTLPVDEFPSLDCEPFTHQFELNGSTFWNAIDAVQGAISTEETRYYLNGIYMHEFQDKLRFVTTDGHRMYCQDLPAPRGCQTMPSGIIPRKAIAIIQKLTKAAKFRPETVKINVSETKFQIEFDNVRIRTKLIDGQFPDYHRVIPANNPNKMHVISKDLSDAIGDVSLISSDRGRAIKLSMMGDILGLSVNNPDAGNAEASIPMHSSGDEVEIGFNSKYLTELLAVAGHGEVQFKMDNAGSPSLITGEREGWQAVLMPMRV